MRRNRVKSYISETENIMAKNEKKDMTVLSGEKLISTPFVDTTIELRVYGASGVFDEVKTKLVKLYGEELSVVADGKRAKLAALVEADDITVEAQPEFDKKRYNAVDAARVIDRLMQKPGGCPWDSVQTHESIRVNMIEEAYEAVDAIDKADLENMREEFGDVFLQSLLQSAIARRDGEFDFNDVCDGLCKKLISRHTFIFGDDKAADSEDALAFWDANKAKEKSYAGVKDQLKRLPSEFPALLRCQKVYKKIKKARALPPDPERDMFAALSKKDYTAAVAAIVGLMSELGKDAEVELNKWVEATVNDL